MTVRAAILSLVALLFIWAGTVVTVFVGVPALVYEPLRDVEGDVLHDVEGDQMLVPPPDADIASHRHFLIYASLGMSLITVGLAMQGAEPAGVLWQRFRTHRTD